MLALLITLYFIALCAVLAFVAHRDLTTTTTKGVTK